MEDREMLKAMLIHEMERWLSPGQAATKLGISRQGVWKAHKAGRLRGAVTAHGLLIDPESVEAMAARPDGRRGSRRGFPGYGGDEG